MAGQASVARASLVAGALLLPLAAHAATFRTLHSFAGNASGDGANPYSGLLDMGGILFGTTQAGGAAAGIGWGTVYQIDPATRAERVVYAFAGGSDGFSPLAALIDVGGMLYGTTTGQSIYGNGTVFAVNPATGTESVLHTFMGIDEGLTPRGALLGVGGTLYGITYGGGTFDAGTVFKVDPTTGAETVLHSFGGTGDGANPGDALIPANGALYGTTEYGGTMNEGTVFRINPVTGRDRVLYSFGTGSAATTDGLSPSAALLKVGSLLYGTTGQGGSAGGGTLFRIAPGPGAETVVHSFGSGSDGSLADFPLINVGGTLYGTTVGGGTSGRGTVFAFDPATGVETVLHSFSGSDGQYPHCALLSFRGVLYGTTYTGGASGNGTVFALKP